MNGTSHYDKDGHFHYEPIIPKLAAWISNYIAAGREIDGHLATAKDVKDGWQVVIFKPACSNN